MKIVWFLNLLFLAGLVACDDAPPPQPLSQEIAAGSETDEDDEYETEDTEKELDSEFVETQSLSPREVAAGLDEEVVGLIKTFLDTVALDIFEGQIEEDRLEEFKDYLDDSGSTVILPDDDSLGPAITYFLGRKLDEGAPVEVDTAAELDNTQPPAEVVTTNPVDNSKVGLYRLYSSKGSDHMFSHDKEEGKGSGYKYESGKGFQLFVHPAPGRHEIYRCLSTYTGNHFIFEGKDCGGTGYKTEGLMGYALSAPADGAVEMHRCYHDSLKNSFTTSNLAECTGASYKKVKTIGYSFPE